MESLEDLIQNLLVQVLQLINELDAQVAGNATLKSFIL
jgi:hypothetical protein